MRIGSYNIDRTKGGFVMTHKKEAKALNFRGDDDVVDEWMKCLTTGEVACV